MARRSKNVARFARVRRKPRRRGGGGALLTGPLPWLVILVALVAVVGTDSLDFDLPATWRGDASSANASAIVGRATVTDGDTLRIREHRIRLHGIDAPESGQTCQDAAGRDYRCGQKAALALSDKIGQQTVSCEERDVDRYGRIVAVCFAGGVDLNGWLVGRGWAVAYRRYSREYIGAEDEAKSARRGIWDGEFVQPEAWRRGER
ncbi:MAG: thermonuclease family protein [Kiloniellaceae bacterium]